jgi:hypothetical protein
MAELNKEIAEDTNNLGPGFCVGHSFFSPTSDDRLLDEGWYRSIVREEIAPLLREYWFDDAKTASSWVARLLA